MTPIRLLAFEQDHPRHSPAKVELIRRELGITEFRYYALLGHAAESADGIAAYPMTARLVHERSVQRAAVRAARGAA